MIFVKDARVLYEGTGLDLLTELSLIIGDLHGKGVPKEMLLDCVEMACKSKEELIAEVKESLKKPENMVKLMTVMTEVLGPDAVAEMVRGADDGKK